MAEIIVGTLFGFFFFGLAIYQFKNGVLISGRGSASTLDRHDVDKNKIMVYVFSTLELVVGVAAFVMVGVSAMGHFSNVGTCNERGEELKCTEFSTGWTLSGIASLCPKKTSAERCEKDNLHGVCTSESKGKKKREFYYNSFLTRGSEIFSPTLEERRSQCTKAKGKWGRP